MRILLVRHAESGNNVLKTDDMDNFEQNRDKDAVITASGREKVKNYFSFKSIKGYFTRKTTQGVEF